MFVLSYGAIYIINDYKNIIRGVYLNYFFILHLNFVLFVYSKSKPN